MLIYSVTTGFNLFSALLFERFSDGSVEIYFRNGTEESNFFDLTQEVCQKVPCKISDLESAWRDVIPLNWDAECHNMDPSPEGFRKMSKNFKKKISKFLF